MHRKIHFPLARRIFARDIGRKERFSRKHTDVRMSGNSKVHRDRSFTKIKEYILKGDISFSPTVSYIRINFALTSRHDENKKARKESRIYLSLPQIKAIVTQDSDVTAV